MNNGCCWPCDPANHTPTRAFVPERCTLLDAVQEQRRAELRELYPDEDLAAVTVLAELREALAQAGLTALYGAALVRRGQIPVLHVHEVGPGAGLRCAEFPPSEQGQSDALKWLRIL